MQLLDLVFLGDVGKLLQEALQVAARKSWDESLEQAKALCKGNQDWGGGAGQPAPGHLPEGHRAGQEAGGPRSPGPALGALPVSV